MDSSETILNEALARRAVKIIRQCEESRASLERRRKAAERAVLLPRNKRQNLLRLESIEREIDYWWVAYILSKWYIGQGLPDDYREKVLPRVRKVIDEIISTS